MNTLFENWRLSKEISELKEENLSLKDKLFGLRTENKELAERNTNQFEAIQRLRQENEIQDSERKELKYIVEKQAAELDLYKYKVFNIPAGMSEAEAAAMLEQLKNEHKVNVDETATAEYEMPLECALWKKEAEIYKELYQKLIKYFIN